MSWWQLVLLAWLALALLRLGYFASKSAYLMRVRAGLKDYHRAVQEQRQSRHEAWLRAQRLKVQSLLFESGLYDNAPAPRHGGRATKLNIYALESLEHWLSEHPRGMARARESLTGAIRIYFARAAQSFNPLYWLGWLLFLPQRVAARIGLAFDPAWEEPIKILYWLVLVGAVAIFIAFLARR